MDLKKGPRRSEASESHLLPPADDASKPGTWYSVSVNDTEFREIRTLFVFIDDRNAGTLYPGSYSIPAGEADKFGLIAGTGDRIIDMDQADLVRGHREDQKDFVTRQKLIWLETWSRVRSKDDRLGSVVVPFDVSKGGQDQLGEFYLKEHRGLSGNEIEPKTPMSRAFLGGTILGQIFTAALLDPREVFLAKLPRSLELQPLPDCGNPSRPPLYLGIRLSSQPRSAP